MATKLQIQANRRNAQLSTGPRTEQGKAASRMNALQTGIDARNEVISGEDPAALAALAAQYDREFQPVGVVERFLVDILIKNDWFLRRYRFIAGDLVNHSTNAPFEAKKGAEFGAGFAANTNAFHRLHRHTVDTERSFFIHLAELERRQAQRRLTDSPQTENPEIGFVPQPEPDSAPNLECPGNIERTSRSLPAESNPPAPDTPSRSSPGTDTSPSSSSEESL